MLLLLLLLLLTPLELLMCLHVSPMPIDKVNEQVDGGDQGLVHTLKVHTLTDQLAPTTMGRQRVGEEGGVEREDGGRVDAVAATHTKVAAGGQGRRAQHRGGAQVRTTQESIPRHQVWRAHRTE
jgi:hypothetical protein